MYHVTILVGIYWQTSNISCTSVGSKIVDHSDVVGALSVGNFFIILEIKVALISYSLSKAASKAAENNGLISLISSHSAPCWQYPS